MTDNDVTVTVPVALSGVVRTFGATSALAGVSFQASRGEMFGLIGPDGAGKTTLLRLICGLDRPTSGDVRVFGVNPATARDVATSSMGYLSQRFSLYGDLSIDENVEFFARLHGVSDFVGRRERLLELTGLRPFRHRLADRLSGGMKQKLALSCTLIHEPPLIVLDEPTTGVDPVSRREFWKLLAECRAGGVTVLIATPYLDEAERCDRVVLLNEGRMLALDTPGRLRSALPGTMIEVVTTGARRAFDGLVATLGADYVQLFGDRLHIRIAGGLSSSDVTDALADAGLAEADMRTVTPSLEDVFIDLLTRPGAGAPDVRAGATS